MARIALISGGTRGIGAAISTAMKAAGYSVAANFAGNTDKAAEFHAATGIPVFQWDVSDYDACVKGIAEVETQLGPIDVLVNNAGITRDGMFHKITPQQWKEVIDTNLSGLFNMTHPVWPGMRERGFGRIINISSVVGATGNPGQGNYAASKAGMVGMSKSLAYEVANRGITVNAVAPGIVETPLMASYTDEQRARLEKTVPMGRMGQSGDIAQAVAFFADEANAYVTGQLLYVCGGRSLSSPSV
mgnify:CR=1 FL=1